MKAQPLAQCQSPCQPILVDLMSVDHLRLRHPVRVNAVERIEDEISVIAGRADPGGDRVEHVEVYGRSKPQFVRSFRPPDPRCGESRKACAGGFEQVSPKHYNSPCRSVLRRIFFASLARAEACLFISTLID